VETGLIYMRSRYYSPSSGRFLSLDLVYLVIRVVRNEGESETNQIVLQNPQMQNSYSYAANNPLVYRDPDGRLLKIMEKAKSKFSAAIKCYVTGHTIMILGLLIE
jgi:RHS repeat-associated protein